MNYCYLDLGQTPSSSDGGIEVSGGGGGKTDTLARTKNKMKQTPEIKVKRKLPIQIPIVQKRKLKPEMIEQINLRLI
jgi:hypothetical protein